MATSRQTLLVLLNGRKTGRLIQEKNGAIEFRYAPDWIALDRRWCYPAAIDAGLTRNSRRSAVGDVGNDAHGEGRVDRENLFGIDAEFV
jgi:hypothetical protein